MICALIVLAGGLIAGAFLKAWNKKVFIAVPAPGRVYLIGSSTYGPCKTIGIMSKPIVMPDFMAELVADTALKGNDATPARKPMNHYAIHIFADRIMSG